MLFPFPIPAMHDGNVHDVNLLGEIEPNAGMKNVQETYEDRTP